jgi:hypothetical protein
MSDAVHPAPTAPDLARTHFRLGWVGVLVFLSLGLVLEALHGFKVGLYLDVDQETRRLMWRLAHAHGTLLSVLHLGFAATLAHLPALAAPLCTLAARCLSGALILMPTGFLLGGVWIHGGDPGLGILLVPPGGLLLLIGVLSIVRAMGRRG